MRDIIVIAQKDIYLILKEKASVILIFALPLAITGLIGILFSNVAANKSDFDAQQAYSYALSLGIIWGIISCAASFSVSMVIEKSNGTLIRLLMSPIKRHNILIGKGVACFIAIVATFILTVIFGELIFNINIHSYFHLFVSMVTISIAFSGVMVFISVFGKNEKSAYGVAWAVLQVMACLGGAMFPMFLMPEWMRKLSNISPVKWSMQSIYSALTNEQSINEMLLTYGILTFIGFLFIILGIKVFKWVN